MEKQNIKIQLVKANNNDAKQLHDMQVIAFAELLNKYKDYDTNPGAETLERVIEKLNQPYTHFYFIKYGEEIVGAIRVKDKKLESEPKNISPIFILQNYRNLGFAQNAIKQAEALHGDTNWEIDTIMQETKLCHFYEKLGYQKTDKQKIVNPNLTLVFYQK